MISKEEVIHIAKLARLQLTEKEITKMQKDLSAILDYFDLLKKAPKLKTQRTLRGQTSQSLRADEIIEKPASMANNLVQAAPDKKDGYVRVKAVL
ncbi:MAG: hypothetical protein A2908_00415 [Candidatus Staskawiczbacteria bacterium RIFCSPLOWO2_01_FULL_38_12b]|uniref:Aspartyl/glutamyl-tRNA(Asn/Gln) amidotransferase subunit C n=1 Tax=Candidatus Staskawiczbacteria bacterium RIFCSPLOWO2_01_FULL_38_12b TaxID=1802214 RepID=A0A1G2IFP9_9BACT|nr:MAG: hypothetical protein A2908_00415 [Candidatus Staskawiczbacteria bacterium RIFCSPLOWO2_01_FULL_38_12b]